ncbi:DUF456 domain-containing protein [Thermomonas alba]|uniref:DUF456 domain-containing protein n=1 Tax=Thermomonas alba TaxID=2888525 RepID=UPI001F042024|nr:DUF456 family protein [Thermomonas alba]
MSLPIVLYVLAAVLVLAGLVGTLLPVLPGAPLVFAGLLLAAWADGFQHVGPWPLLALGALTLLALTVDLWASAHGARRVGASRLAMLGATLGSVIGLFFGLPGLLLGPFLGALIGELLHRRSLHPQHLGAAGKVGAGTWLGLALGAAFKLALALTMVGVFALAWWL